MDFIGLTGVQVSSADIAPRRWWLESVPWLHRHVCRSSSSDRRLSEGGTRSAAQPLPSSRHQGGFPSPLDDDFGVRCCRSWSHVTLWSFAACAAAVSLSQNCKQLFTHSFIIVTCCLYSPMFYFVLHVSSSFLLHFWHVRLGVCSAKVCHQSPECTILSHISCFIQGEVTGFQVLLDSLYTRSTRAVQWSPLVLQGKAGKIFLASVLCGILAVWPNREKRRAWMIAERCGCLVVCLTSAFHTWRIRSSQCSRVICIIFSYVGDMPYTSALFVVGIVDLTKHVDLLSRDFFNTFLQPSSYLSWYPTSELCQNFRAFLKIYQSFMSF